MYPTREQILAKKPKFKKGIIPLVKLWKKNNIKEWRLKTSKQKIKALKELIKALEDIYENPVKEIIIKTEDMYDEKNKSIYLDKNKISIISTLHEFAHHIFGPSEFTACIWSIWLFKICFPGLYDNLKWENHLLIKK